MKLTLSSILAFATASVLVFGQTPLPSTSPSPPPNVCFFNTNQGATYDLSVFNDQNFYTIEDDRNNNGQPLFMYTVSMCKNIVLKQTSLPQACYVTTGANGTSSKGPAPAFQYFPNQTSNPGCWRLGNTWSNNNIALLNPSDPSAGLSITYLNGDICNPPAGSNQGFIPRSMMLGLACYPNNGVLLYNETVTETSKCQFQTIIYTSLACPQQCPIVNFQVCNGHGVCGYDTTNLVARCFCDSGYSDSYCITNSNPSFWTNPIASGPIAGGFFGGLALGGLVAIAFVYYQRNKNAPRGTMQSSKSTYAPAFAGSTTPDYAPPSSTSSPVISTML